MSQRVACDAAAYLPELAFPEAYPTVILAERTFMEKVTPMHVFCRRELGRGERLSRHRHDLARLYEADAAASAIADHALALSVSRHKVIFFIENNARGERIDYQAAVSKHHQLVPDGDRRADLAYEYGNMLADGMLRDTSEPFDALMERCSAANARANAAWSKRS